MRANYAIALISLAAFVAAASAAEPGKSGVYVGAEVGSAKADSNVQTSVWLYDVNSSTTGWGLFAGFRRAKFLGVEIAYIDFGTSEKHNLDDGNGNIAYSASAKNDAFGGFVVGYLPLVPSFDLFAKVGYASLHTKTDSNGNYPNADHCTPVCVPVGMASLSQSRTSGDFVWGVGAQYHFNSMSVRAAYQKIEGGSTGSPSLVSLGLAWRF